MKTVHDRNGQPATYYTQTEVAELLGLSHNTFWARVYRDGSYPKPTVRIAKGRRLYYPASVVEALVASHRAEEGVVS